MECRRAEVPGWSASGQRRAPHLESASASHRGAAASLLDQVQLRCRLVEKAITHTHLQVTGRSASGHRRARTLSPPQPRTEEQPQACSIRWSFINAGAVARSTHTHLQVPGWSAGGQKRARTLSPPPPRTEEQPQACSIRWSFDGGSVAKANTLQGAWLECRRQRRARTLSPPPSCIVHRGAAASLLGQSEHHHGGSFHCIRHTHHLQVPGAWRQARSS